MFGADSHPLGFFSMTQLNLNLKLNLKLNLDLS